jgi:hypothetical protein
MPEIRPGNPPALWLAGFATQRQVRPGVGPEYCGNR